MLLVRHLRPSETAMFCRSTHRTSIFLSRMEGIISESAEWTGLSESKSFPYVLNFAMYGLGIVLYICGQRRLWSSDVF
jgi:hypothetical protein